MSANSILGQYANPAKHIKILETLNTKKQGLTRERIASLIDFGNGGNLTRILHDLEECGFIRRLKPFGKKKNTSLYYLADPFVAFYLTFIRNSESENYWSSYLDNAGHRAWSGFAFEQACFAHIIPIKKALGISGVHTNISSWIGRGNDKGAQIDLVIDRGDRVINICEIKFAKGPLEIDCKLESELREKIEIFRNATKTLKALHITMITTYGIKPGKYAGIVQSEVTMDELIR